MGSSRPAPLAGRALLAGAAALDGDAAAITGLVLQIQRMSTEDGPGLRSSAFLKGCPLSCAWCHNPESIETRPQVQWLGLRCIAGRTADGCGACLRSCPRGALSRGAQGNIEVERASCVGCGTCAEACPGGAMELLGTRMEAGQLADELLKDLSWWKASERGGITLTGGEASLQAVFALEVFRLCRKAGAHTALDTCGLAKWETLEGLYSQVDLVLYDLKEADSGRHRVFTGAGNELVLANFERTAALMRSAAMPASMWIRTPIIPGATDSEENLLALGELIARADPPRLERWELCAFNKLCAGKYRSLGRKWDYEEASLMRREDLERLAGSARRATGGKVEVSWTGSCRD